MITCPKCRLVMVDLHPYIVVSGIYEVPEKYVRRLRCNNCDLTIEQDFRVVEEDE